MIRTALLGIGCLLGFAELANAQPYNYGGGYGGYGGYGGGIGGGSAAWLARDGASVMIMGRTETTLIEASEMISVGRFGAEADALERLLITRQHHALARSDLP